jgi:hypothetical protein
MPANFGSRNSKLKNGGTISEVHVSVMAICSEDERNALKHIPFSSQWKFPK